MKTEKPDDKKLSAPNNYTFEGQKSEEDIILHLKRHPMTMYKQALILVAGFLAVVAVFTTFGASAPSAAAIFVYLIAGGFYGFRTWYLWWSSHYILTNQRVIAVEQMAFFHRLVSEAPLDKIQNVVYEIKGPYQTFLDFGNIRILTAGQKEADVEFRGVAHPYDVQQEVTRCAHEFGNIFIEAKQALGGS